MGYPPRIESPGDAYHVNGNGVDGCKLFRDEEDRQFFLFLLRRELARSGWTCIAYSLMSTHYHVIVKPERCLAEQRFSASPFGLCSVVQQEARPAWRVVAAAIPRRSDRQRASVARDRQVRGSERPEGEHVRGPEGSCLVQLRSGNRDLRTRSVDHRARTAGALPSPGNRGAKASARVRRRGRPAQAPVSDTCQRPFTPQAARPRRRAAPRSSR